MNLKDEVRKDRDSTARLIANLFSRVIALEAGFVEADWIGRAEGSEPERAEPAPKCGSCGGELDPDWACLANGDCLSGTLPPFGSVKECPKCGEKQPEYQGANYNEGQNCMEQFCGSCGYSWQEQKFLW